MAGADFTKVLLLQFSVFNPTSFHLDWKKKVLPALFERLSLSVNLFVSDIPFLLAVVSFSVPVSVGLAWREHAIFKI